jgi:acyl transferase domain-containing protein
MNRPSLASAIRIAPAPAPAGADAAVYVRALSAASEAGLRSAARRLAAGRRTPAAAAPSLFGRHRLVAIADTPAAAAGKLAAFAAGRAVDGLWTGARPDAGARRVAFIFTGLGVEHVGMGRRLYAQSRVFRRELQACDALYRQHCGEPLLFDDDLPFGDGAALQRTAYAQPALFAFEYALAQVWRAAGVEPSAVIGYSLGEDVAACVAGVAPRDELFAFVIERARLMEHHHDGGEMAAVFADERRVQHAIAPYPNVAVAAINGPENTVVSGPAREIDALLATLTLQRIRTRRVATRHAFHSPSMDPLLDRIERAASALPLRAPRLPFVSSATGRWASSEVTDARFWSRRIRETVRFSDCVRLLHAEGYRVLVEIGPHPVLLSIASRCLPDADLLCVPALRRDGDDVAMTAQGFAAVFVNGVDVWWRTLDGVPAEAPAMFAAIPTAQRTDITR